MRTPWIVLVALLAAAGVPLVGRWALAIAVLLGVIALLGPRASDEMRAWLPRSAVAVALLGTFVGVYSADIGLASQGLGSPRAPLGIAALVLAILAGAGSLLANTRPGLASLVVVGCGLAGAVAMNLFFINTPYVLAVPLWMLAAALALLRPRQLTAA